MEKDKTITDDLAEFGFVELEIASKILTAYCEQHPPFLGDGVKLWFNKNSGCVFLCDEDYNTAMMNEDKLEQWHNCPECGHEGFLEDMGHEHNSHCKDFLKDIGFDKIADSFV